MKVQPWMLMLCLVTCIIVSLTMLGCHLTISFHAETQAFKGGMIASAHYGWCAATNKTSWMAVSNDIEQIFSQVIAKKE